MEEEEPRRVSLLKVSARSVQIDKTKLIQNALERSWREAARRLPENQAVAKEEEREEEEEAMEEDVVEALSPPRWTSPSMPLRRCCMCVCSDVC